MKIVASDKTIDSLMATPAGSAVKGMQPKVAEKIRRILSVLCVADDLATVAKKHGSWRVHQWPNTKKGRSARYSIDVEGNTRLLFNYDKQTHLISGLVFEDPH